MYYKVVAIDRSHKVYSELNDLVQGLSLEQAKQLKEIAVMISKDQPIPGIETNRAMDLSVLTRPGLEKIIGRIKFVLPTEERARNAGISKGLYFTKKGGLIYSDQNNMEIYVKTIAEKFKLKQLYVPNYDQSRRICLDLIFNEALREMGFYWLPVFSDKKNPDRNVNVFEMFEDPSKFSLSYMYLKSDGNQLYNFYGLHDLDRDHSTLANLFGTIY